MDATETAGFSARCENNHIYLRHEKEGKLHVPIQAQVKRIWSSGRVAIRRKKHFIVGHKQHDNPYCRGVDIDGCMYCKYIEREGLIFTW